MPGYFVKTSKCEKQA